MWHILLAAGLASAASAEMPSGADIIVTATLPGGAADADAVPTARWTVDPSALQRGATSLLRALDTALPGVAVDEAQGNPYQPNLYYRGFEASPLGGDAQGLAVYVDGTRFNQPFGDTVNWDLIPDAAVARVTLEGSNPVFGLNALGGALAVDLKTGRDAPGIGGETSVARFGGRQVSASAGGVSGALSTLIVAEVQHDDGWRAHSPSTVRRGYAQVGLDGAWGTADVRLLGAQTDLTGNGTAPVELLAADRSAVFTYPDDTRNRYGRALLDADVVLAPGIRLRPRAHLDRFVQRTANGDLSDAAPCEDKATLLCLDGDANARLTDMDGATFPAFAGSDTAYGQLNRTRTRTTAYGGAIELTMERGPHNLALGTVVEGSRTRFDAQSLLGALSDDRGFEDAQGTIDQVDGPIRPVDVTTDRTDLGLYGSDRIALTSTLDLTVGARYNSSRVTLHDRLGTALSGRHVYRRLSPAGGLAWRVRPDVSFYAGYAETSRAPTPAELSCADAAAPCALSAFFLSDPSLKQVVSHTVEAGVRGTSRLGGARFDWHFGGWRTVSDDDIIFAASDIRSRAFFRNVGRTRRQGIEATLDARTGPWRGTLAYTLTDATFRTPFTLDSPDNLEADADGLISVVRGDRLPSIPRNLVKASVERRFGGDATIAVSARYASGRWLVGDEANLTRPTAAYTVCDVSGGLPVGHGFEFFGEITNLFDRRYATFGGFADTSGIALNEAPGATDPRALSPGMPRRWRFGVRAHF